MSPVADIVTGKVYVASSSHCFISVLASAYFPIFVEKAVCELPKFGMLTSITYTILLDFSKRISESLCKTDLSVSIPLSQYCVRLFSKTSDGLYLQ